MVAYFMTEAEVDAKTGIQGSYRKGVRIKGYRYDRNPSQLVNPQYSYNSTTFDTLVDLVDHLCSEGGGAPLLPAAAAASSDPNKCAKCGTGKRGRPTVDTTSVYICPTCKSAHAEDHTPTRSPKRRKAPVVQDRAAAVPIRATGRFYILQALFSGCNERRDIIGFITGRCDYGQDTTNGAQGTIVTDLEQPATQ